MAEQQIESQGGRVVLISVDDSDAAQYAFFFYVDNLRKEGDRIVFAHVPESYDFWQTPQHLKEELIHKINERVNALEAKYGALVEQKGVTSPKPLFKTRAGHPGEQIVKLVEELNPAFVVCGSRGLGKVRRTILGSVSEFILHHSHKPVLIYHHKK